MDDVTEKTTDANVTERIIVSDVTERTVDVTVKPMDVDRALPSVIEFAHEQVAGRLKKGDLAIDATVGNGFDTLFLARCVGTGGRVIGFDIQEEALNRARQRLIEHDREHDEGVAPRVSMLRMGHERMQEGIRQVLGEPHFLKLKAVMFNLGYLPGADKTVITQADTTIAAIGEALHLLSEGGILSVIVYPGHVGGDAEAAAVKSFLTNVPRKKYQVMCYRPVNTSETSPFAYIALKLLK